MKLLSTLLFMTSTLFSLSASAAPNCNRFEVKRCKSSCKYNNMKYALCDYSKGYARCGCYTNSGKVQIIKLKAGKANNKRTSQPK